MPIEFIVWYFISLNFVLLDWSSFFQQTGKIIFPTSCIKTKFMEFRTQASWSIGNRIWWTQSLSLEKWDRHFSIFALVYTCSWFLIIVKGCIKPRKGYLSPGSANLLWSMTLAILRLSDEERGSRDICPPEIDRNLMLCRKQLIWPLDIWHEHSLGFGSEGW